MGMHPLLNDALADHGFLAIADHPDLRDVVKRASRAGALQRLLPGIWAPPGTLHWALCASALHRFDPDAVLTGATALAILRQDAPTLPLAVAAPRHHVSNAIARFTRRQVPPELTARGGGPACTVPALTAVDLAAGDGGDAIDQVLRMRRATLTQMWLAFETCGRRHGDPVRRAVLRASRAEPWSRAERVAHAILHAAGITGWTANAGIEAGGSRYYGDIVFRKRRVVVEIDGWEHHRSWEAFERDRTRQNALVLAGWTVLRFTWATLTGQPDLVVEQIVAALS